MADIATVVLGYTCICGEKVNVFDLQGGTINQLPAPDDRLSNGHTATFSSKQVGLLDVWCRDGAQEQFATAKAA
jgi:hypothetical protein